MDLTVRISCCHQNDAPIAGGEISRDVHIRIIGVVYHQKPSVLNIGEPRFSSFKISFQATSAGDVQEPSLGGFSAACIDPENAPEPNTYTQWLDKIFQTVAYSSR